jgi:thiol-disulfide isomerase/thioredoxin
MCILYRGGVRAVLATLLVSALPCLSVGCATAHRTSPTRPPVAADPNDRCVHGVACETCVKCHPELAAKFKAAGDWCPEHDVPESQCGICHPELIVAPPEPPAGADFKRLVDAGQDVPALESLAVSGKITIFDFYADWCGPCRRVDEHVFALLKNRNDVAYRKLNVVSWESPLTKHYLSRVPSLPYVIVYGKHGKLAGTMSGPHLADLDRAIDAASNSP